MSKSAQDVPGMLTFHCPKPSSACSGCSSRVYYAYGPPRTARLARARPLGQWTSSARTSATVSEGGSRRPMWPPRYLLRTIEALSIPHRQSGASSRAREAHGVLPNSHHDPSSRGARDIAESAFQLIFREGSRSRIPRGGKGVRPKTLTLSRTIPPGPTGARLLSTVSLSVTTYIL